MARSQPPPERTPAACRSEACGQFEAENAGLRGNGEIIAALRAKPDTAGEIFLVEQVLDIKGGRDRTTTNVVPASAQVDDLIGRQKRLRSARLPVVGDIHRRQIGRAHV